MKHVLCANIISKTGFINYRVVMEKVSILVKLNLKIIRNCYYSKIYEVCVGLCSNICPPF
jgi:hypothetical protein